MNLADVFTFLFVTLGFVIAFVAYWLLGAGLFPRFTERAAERYGTSPVKSTILGAVIAVPLVVGGLTFSGKAGNGGLKLAGLVIALIPLFLSLFGSAGLALRIGRGLKSQRDEVEPWRRTLRGSIVLALSFLLPVLGWFGVLPLVLVSGFGVFLLSLRRPTVAILSAQVPAAEPIHSASAIPATPV